MNRLARLGMLVAALTCVGCQATPPTAPSPVVVQLVVLQRDRGVLVAYTLNSDGGYRDVTSTAVWSSNNPAVPSFGQGRFQGIGDQNVTATALATLDGAVGQFLMTANQRTSFPRGPNERLSVNNSPSMNVGTTSDLSLNYSAPFVFTNVTQVSTWTSSDETILAVDRGRLVARRVGTVEITASYLDLSIRFSVSVLPEVRVRL